MILNKEVHKVRVCFVGCNTIKEKGVMNRQLKVDTKGERPLTKDGVLPG